MCGRCRGRCVDSSSHPPSPGRPPAPLGIAEKEKRRTRTKKKSKRMLRIAVYFFKILYGNCNN